MSEEGIKRTIINTAAVETVDKLVADLCNRGGLDGAWNEIDRNTRREIREKWARIVANGIKKAIGE